MKKRKKKVVFWERYLSTEIGIEFKACLYFFCILFFYSVYKLALGSFEANIIHMAEMILLTYFMGWMQLFFLSNFDEGERLGLKEWGYLLICSGIYTGISYMGAWFDRKVAVSAGFLCYMIVVYICAFLVYSSKRKLDENQMNEALKLFQARKREDADENGN